MAGAEQDRDGDPDSVRASVVVGTYRVDVGSPVGSSIEPLPPGAGESKAAQAELSRAISRRKPPGPVEAIDAASDDAEQVTDQTERALNLWTSVATGRLDVGAVNGEIDTLLALLQKLDREGRFEEQLRLARALSRLLAVALRWLDLLRSLRGLLKAAEHHPEAKAWALHELGTLHLAAGKHAGAEKLLGDARELRVQLGDKRALAATDRNLEVLCRALRQLMRKGDLRERGHLRDLRHVLRAHAVLATATLFVLMGGGSAIAFLGGGGVKRPPAPSTPVASIVPPSAKSNPPAAPPPPVPVTNIPSTPGAPPAQVGRPAVTGLRPAGGYTHGGALVTILGSGLAQATDVEFGTRRAEVAKRISDTALEVFSPSSSATGDCVVDVVVTTPGGMSAKTGRDRFGYLDCTQTTTTDTSTTTTTTPTTTTATPTTTTATTASPPPSSPIH